MIVLSQEFVTELLEKYGLNHHIELPFISLDDDDVFVSNNLTDGTGRKRKVVNGILRAAWGQPEIDIHSLAPEIGVLVMIHLKEGASTSSIASQDFTCSGMVRKEHLFESRPVQLIPIREKLFNRVRGMYETNVLKEKIALLIGVGSGGGTIAIELAKAGVGRFILVDHDRLEVVNVVRHVCGIQDLGRFKTKAVRDLILDKNPFAEVETYENQCDESWLLTLRQLVKRADIVFCGTDNRPSRTLVNRVCVEEQRVCIYGGTFRRAYGGHVLRVIPGQTMCYQCFIDLLPAAAADQEIASEIQAERIAYSDHLVAIEPGLATDIAPIAIMCVKIGILELLRGTPTTLSNLYEDLQAAWFQWLNRREPDTEYANLKPIDSGEDDYRILAWYGIMNEKNPGCPICGNFVEVQLKQRPTSEQIAEFEPSLLETVRDKLLFPPS